MSETLADVARSWTALGREDPMWAALTDPRRSSKRRHRDEFLATGAAEVTALMATLAQRGVPPTLGAALDFGCGPSRLTAALALAGFDSVIGMDISQQMLAKAAELVTRPTVPIRPQPWDRADWGREPQRRSCVHVSSAATHASRPGSRLCP